MKKTFVLLIGLLAVMVAGIDVRAQEVTITLWQGWNWISYPKAVSMEIGEALGDFVPMNGDVIKSQEALAEYNGSSWTGSLTHLVPGKGFMYYSARDEVTSFVFAEPITDSPVATSAPTDITIVSAVVGGTVNVPEGGHVFLCGVCWGTEPNPTIDGNHTSEELVEGSFSSTLEDLTPNTTYYVRAYTVTDDGLAYGEELEFTTMSGIPEVSTTEVTEITVTTALCGGMVTGESGLAITACGICWGTEPNPTIDGNHTSEELIEGSFSSTLEDLTPNTTYYVRAYAMTDYGLAYGEELTFTTLSNAPIGAIDGKFTINNDGSQVYFSQGNLQYIGSAAEPYWKFADNQWDCLGTTTGQNSTDENVDRDLFGWGTSGWNCGNHCYYPWETFNSSGSSYGPAGANNLTGTYANSDWGVYNPISNGGDQPELWRTLSKDEWGYVFNTRTTASGIRFAKANVNEMNGVILLPDDWSTDYYDLIDTNTKEASYASNTITASEWNTLEQHGAVFMPAIGYRFGSSVRSVGNNGYYWSSSYVNSNYAYGVYFYDSNLNPQDCSNRTYGRGVRLVQVVAE